MSLGLSETRTADGLLAVQEKIMWLSQALKKEGWEFGSCSCSLHCGWLIT